MRIVIQRVKKAAVFISGSCHSSIDHGLLLLAGIEEADTDEDIRWLVNKVTAMRIFTDDAGLMNRSVSETGGNILLVSQFTLFASTKKGNRPSYIRAARPDIAIPLYESLIAAFNAAMDRKIETGLFGADMQVELINDGPVTILIDSKNRE